MVSGCAWIIGVIVIICLFINYPGIMFGLSGVCLFVFIIFKIFSRQTEQTEQTKQTEQTGGFWDSPLTKQIGTFTDPRDGKTYKTVTIGNQTWMAENLDYKEESSQCYDQKYGRLYYWEKAKEVCPPGWHLPSSAEWMTLANFAGNLGKLKSTSGWGRGYIDSGTDDYGFAALPGGCVFFGEPHCIGDVGYWWTSDDPNNDNKGLFINIANVGYNWWDKADKCSVRCVKD